ncbi:basic salivary proline-rich protein [Salix suchowensis]|nr:basic salivary proline-rich protein [Salix suchowensis]
MLRALSLAVILLLVGSIFFIGSTEARPVSILKSRNSAASRAIGSFFDGLSLAQIKQSGPSPGVGHGYTTGTHQ